MAIVTDAQYREVQASGPPEFFTVGLRSGLGATFGRDRMYLCRGNWHLVEPGFARHSVIAFRIVDGYAALVTEVHVPGEPVRRQPSQPLLQWVGPPAGWGARSC